jgi:hypothetical protein
MTKYLFITVISVALAHCIIAVNQVFLAFFKFYSITFNFVLFSKDPNPEGLRNSVGSFNGSPVLRKLQEEILREVNFKSILHELDLSTLTSTETTSKQIQICQRLKASSAIHEHKKTHRQPALRVE